MTPQELIDWADRIDRRLEAISGRQADGLAVFLRRAARALDNALDDRRRLSISKKCAMSQAILYAGERRREQRVFGMVLASIVSQG